MIGTRSSLEWLELVTFLEEKGILQTSQFTEVNLERIVNQKFLHFFESNQLFPSNHHGIRKGVTRINIYSS